MFTIIYLLALRLHDGAYDHKLLGDDEFSSHRRCLLKSFNALKYIMLRSFVLLFSSLLKNSHIICTSHAPFDISDVWNSLF